ncbi:hypothetical protein F4782DRAFT_520166 [Xylaria castorea]|nr:hypothetical protein F4782DRAFT_520166 [Xylaria castorea]
MERTAQVQRVDMKPPAGTPVGLVAQLGDGVLVHGEALHVQREQRVAAEGLGLARDGPQDDGSAACVTCHCKTCGTAAVVNSKAIGPKLLVDVEDECLVSAERHRYAALSYVWGGAGGTEATGRPWISFNIPVL